MKTGTIYRKTYHQGKTEQWNLSALKLEAGDKTSKLVKSHSTELTKIDVVIVNLGIRNGYHT